LAVVLDAAILGRRLPKTPAARQVRFEAARQRLTLDAAVLYIAQRRQVRYVRRWADRRRRGRVGRWLGVRRTAVQRRRRPRATRTSSGLDPQKPVVTIPAT
jgi:hypothetical protein